METQITQTDTNLMGNTSTIRSRRWCFTLNNYTDKEYSDIKYFMLHKKHSSFIIGKEVGSKGTPHLQGYVNFKNAVAFDTLKKVCKGLHLEKAKGNDKANFDYCSKEGNFETNMIFGRNMKQLKKWYDNVEWRPHQKTILNIVNGEKDNRIINWVVDPVGDSGKSYLAKYIFLTKKTIIADGKKDNIFNQILNFYDENPDDEIDVVILDIPRHNENFVNYGVLEQIKNGLIYSGKYEGGSIAFDPPHIIIFSNFDPDESKFSADRWNIIRINYDI